MAWMSAILGWRIITLSLVPPHTPTTGLATDTSRDPHSPSTIDWDACVVVEINDYSHNIYKAIRISLQTSAQGSISLQTIASAQSRISPQTGAQGRISLQTGAVGRISLQTGALGRISLQTSAQSRISLQTSAQSRISQNLLVHLYTVRVRLSRSQPCNNT